MLAWLESLRADAVFGWRQLKKHWVTSAAAILSLALGIDRKSTRLNSSHQIISYAVFCLKKKKKQEITEPRSRNYSAAVHQQHLRCRHVFPPVLHYIATISGTTALSDKQHCNHVQTLRRT